MPDTDLPRSYISLGTEELSARFATICLSGDRDAYALLVHEMGFRRKFMSTMDAFGTLGDALLDRSSPGPGARDALSVVHAVLGMGPPTEGEVSGTPARIRIRELQKEFHSDKFVNGDAKVIALADRFMALLNSMVELLPPKSGT